MKMGRFNVHVGALQAFFGLIVARLWFSDNPERLVIMATQRGFTTCRVQCKARRRA